VAELKPDQAAQGLSLSRWSRLKRAAADERAAAPVVSADAAITSVTPENGGDPLSRNSGQAAISANGQYAELPPLSAISLAEDFTPFMQAKVPQALKQQALKALFKEPHFNVMDGLDIYIDDYTVFEPIAPEVMATLSSWKSIMNPPQQIVTPQGYAVDVESDEGKAVLAARGQSIEANVLPAQTIGDEPVTPPAARSDTPFALGSGAEGEGGDMPEPTSQTSDLTSTDEPLQLNDDARATALTPALSRAAGEGARTHIRYGKRVGDFSPSAQATLDELQPQILSPDSVSADTQKNSS
jgi:Protein of unknown function (DUF3306)